MLRSNPLTSPKALVLIEPDLMAKFETFRQLTQRAPEAGGILLGYRRGEHLHVTEATFPHAEDRQGRYSFHRHARHHQRRALTRWAATNHTMDYLGEWHTHPEEIPSPSTVDVRNWREITAGRGVPMLFLICGMSSYWLGAGLSGSFLELPGASGFSNQAAQAG